MIDSVSNKRERECVCEAFSSAENITAQVEQRLKSEGTLLLSHWAAESINEALIGLLFE